MTRYILIDIEKDKNPNELLPRNEEDRYFDIKDEVSASLFICEKCFKTFNTRNLSHLDACRIEWPYQDSNLCKMIMNPKLLIYRINEEKDQVNKKIIFAIDNLGLLSKREQGLDFQISTKRLLGKTYFGIQGNYRYYYYLLFSYKNIVAFCLIQEYRSFFTSKSKIIIKDIYTFPPYRGNNYSYFLISTISKNYGKKVEDLLYTEPLSEPFRFLLKKNNVKKVKTLFGNNFRTIKEVFI